MEIIELMSLIKIGSDIQLNESLAIIDNEIEWLKDCRGKIEAEVKRRKEVKKIQVACPQCEGRGHDAGKTCVQSATKYKCLVCDGKWFLMATPWEEK